ncbi:MAG TPA: hypothetical protein VLE74_02135 [Candidatus Saccharimonadales bacterium]|nr:hypothetical protein [Candidatus Saccharimonadales bacterium]
MKTDNSESQPLSPDRTQRRSKRVIAAGVAVGLLAVAAGGYAAIDNLRSGKGNRPVATATPNQPKASGSETTGRFERFVPVPVTPEAAQSMARETATLTPSSCSAGIISDSAGKAIGFNGAEHCFDADIRQANTDGSGRSTLHGLYKGYRDNALSGSNFLGYVSALVTDNAAGKDMVIGAFEGNSIDAVLAAHEAMTIPADQLKAGDDVYFSGLASGHNGQRQDFAGSVLGTENGLQSGNKKIDVLWVATDGICTTGVSGAEGFVLHDGQRRNFGNLSAYWNFNGPEATPAAQATIKDKFTNQFGIDLTAANSVCGFVTMAPNPTSTSGNVVQVSAG